MKKILLMSMLISQFVFGQDYVNQVFVLNEGYYNYDTFEIETPVTIGVYNPVTNVYAVVDTIEGARFASDILIDGDYFYVAADKELLKYDINTYELLYSQELIGIRKLAIADGELYATRGEYLQTFGSYLNVYSAMDLSLVNTYDTISGPKWASEGVVVVGDNVYVAINNGFEWGNYKALIGVVDLPSSSYENEIDLGPDGKNPDNLMTDGVNLYTVNNKDFTGASVSKVALVSSEVSTLNIASASTGCGTSCLREGKINYQVSGETDLYEWNPAEATTDGTSLSFTKNFYGLAVDNINSYLYASSTDYSTYGTVHVYDESNNLINEFDCGVSPGNIAFDVRSSVGISELEAQNLLQGSTFDLFGRKLNSLENEAKGVYLKDGKKVYNN